MAQNIGGKYVKDFAAGGSSDLLVAKLDEVIGQFNKMEDDYDALRTKFIALLAKLDDDAVDTGGDADYESTQTPAAATAAKVSKKVEDLLMPSPKKMGV